MKRILAAAAMAAAVSFAVTGVATTDAEAAKKITKNVCKAKTDAGKKVTWNCAPDEKCCWAAATSKAACVPKSGICL